MSGTEPPPQAYEVRPDPQQLTQNSDSSKNSTTGVDYEPHPSESIQLPPQREKIVRSICNLYSGSKSEEDMRVYAEQAVYDDPWSYCVTRHEIAGQWWGIPILFNSKTLATQIVSSTQDPNVISFKLRQEYNPKGMEFAGKAVNSLVTLTLDDEERVKYHKDQWNEKDYSHEGLGKAMKTLNGRHLTKVTRPPESLKEGP